MGDWNNPPEVLASLGWLHAISGGIVAHDHPSCGTTNARELSVLDYAVVSNWLTPMVKAIYADEEDPYQPHRRVYLKMQIAPKCIHEVAAVCPTSFPQERLIGRSNEYKMNCKWEDLRNPWNLPLDDHAAMIMDRIENELLYKINVDHVYDHRGTSPYRGRSEGFNIRKQKAPSLVKPNTIKKSYPVKAFRLAAQNVGEVCKALRKHEPRAYVMVAIRTRIK